MTASARIFHVSYFPTSSKHRPTDADQPTARRQSAGQPRPSSHTHLLRLLHDSHRYRRSDRHSHIADLPQPSLLTALLLAHSTTLVLSSSSHRSQQIISDCCMPAVRPWQQKSSMPSRQCAINCIHDTQNTDTTYCRLRPRPTCLGRPAKPQYSHRSLGPI